MRLWHYKLIPYLPKKQLVAQWRDCIVCKYIHITNENSPLVNYIKNYDATYLTFYTYLLLEEFKKRGIKYNKQKYGEFYVWGDIGYFEMNKITDKDYPMFKEHDDEYMKICYWNLKEKYLRGIIPQDEWEILDKYTRSSYNI